jgi:hypothetical protein
MSAVASQRSSITRAYLGARAKEEGRDARDVRRGTFTFDAHAYSPLALAKIRARWQVQRLVEYRSTSVFLDLAKQLMAASAPLESTAVAVRMAQDEYRHADLCAHVAGLLGAASLAPLPVTLQVIAEHADVSRPVAALRNVIVCTCISETSAVANLVVELEHLTCPLLRAATRALLADEVLHGEFGFRYLEQWAPFLANSPGARGEISSYLRFAFAFAERELAHAHIETSLETGIAGAITKTSTAEERSLGLLDGATRRDVFLQTMQHAVIPGLEQFGISAEHAFRTRSLS